MGEKLRFVSAGSLGYGVWNYSKTWVPGARFLHGLTLSALFTDHIPLSTSDLYTLNDIRGLLNKYITSQQLINPHDQAYINLNGPLVACISSKHSGEPGKKAEKTPGEDKSSLLPEFMKRDELMRNIVEHMQPWHEVKAEGKDIITA